MRHYAQLALATSILFAVVGCAQPAATPVAQVPAAVTPVASTVKADASRLIVANAIAKSAKPMVKDLGHANGASVAVSFSTPRAARKVQALQHRWITSDIQTYQAVLLTTDPNGQYTETVATLDIAAADYNTSTSSSPGLVAFTGLEANKLYKVEVSAWGSNSSTAETADHQKMNTQTTAKAYFNFIEDGNATIEDTPAAQDVTIVLDSYEFNGAATVNATVTEGYFENVPGAVTATVIAPQAGLYFKGLTENGDSRFDFVVEVPANTTLGKLQANTYAHALGWLIYNNIAFLSSAETGNYDQNVLPSVQVNGAEVAPSEFQTPGRFSGFVTFNVVVPGSNVQRNFGLYLIDNQSTVLDYHESNFIN